MELINVIFTPNLLNKNTSNGEITKDKPKEIIILLARFCFLSKTKLHTYPGKNRIKTLPKTNLKDSKIVSLKDKAKTAIKTNAIKINTPKITFLLLIFVFNIF